jgi:hypothetical protein
MASKLPSTHDYQEGLFQQRRGFFPQRTLLFARRNRVVDRAIVVEIISDALELVQGHAPDAMTGNDEAVKKQ